MATDSLTIEGEEYISSKRAAKETGYTQDYIGQLARGGAITARRVSGHWYIVLDSLKAYKTKADSYKPTPPPPIPAQDRDTSITVLGKEYLSASAAAKLSGYNQDYVGQLARSGKIPSQQMGNRWFIEKDALLNHKEEKDALLAEVQAEAVGLHAPSTNSTQETAAEPLSNAEISKPEPFFTYSAEQANLLPPIAALDKPAQQIEIHKEPLLPVATAPAQPEAKPIQIQKTFAPPMVERKPLTPLKPAAAQHRPAQAKKRSPINPFALVAGVLTIVIVMTFAFTSLREKALYAFSQLTGGQTASATLSSPGLANAAQFLEGLFARNIEYRAPNQ